MLDDNTVAAEKKAGAGRHMSFIQARSRPVSSGGTDLYEEPFTNFGANAVLSAGTQ